MGSHALAMLALAAPVLLAAQPKSLLTLDEFTSDWRISKDFTVAVADKMPTEFYSFKANPEEMTFGQQMVHLSGALVFRFHQLTGAPAPEGKAPDPNDKPAVIPFIKLCFDYVIGLLPKITGEQLLKPFKVDWPGRPEVNGRQMMMNMFMHVAHHRAQCEVYLRLKNITPPTYTF